MNHCLIRTIPISDSWEEDEDDRTRGRHSGDTTGQRVHSSRSSEKVDPFLRL